MGCQVTLAKGVKCPNKGTHVFRGYVLCRKHYQDAIRSYKALSRLPKRRKRRKRKKRR